MSKRPVIKQIFNSSALLLIGNIIGRATMFIVNIIAARMLTQESFGQFMFLRSSISMFDGILSASFGNITVKKTSEYNKNISILKEFLFSLFLVNLVLVIIIAILIFIFRDEIIYSFFLNDYSLLKLVYVSLFILFTSIFSSVAQKINIGLSNYKEMAILSMGNLLIGLPLILYFINNFKLIGLLWGVGLYFLIDFIFKFSIFMFKQKLIIKPNHILNVEQHIKELFSSASLLLGAAIVSSVSFWLFRVIIVKKSEGFSMIAAFDSAYQMFTIIMLITGATTSIALQMLSSNKKDNVRVFRLNLGVNLLIAIFFSLTFSFFAHEIMLIYGNDYTQYYYLIYVVSALTIFATIDSVYNKLFIIKNNSRIIMRHTLVSAIISIIFVCYIQEMNLSLLLAYTFLLFYFSFFLLDTLYIFFNYKEYFIDKVMR